MNNSTFITNALAKITRVTLSAKRKRQNFAQSPYFLDVYQHCNSRQMPMLRIKPTTSSAAPRSLRRGSHSVIIR